MQAEGFLGFKMGLPIGSMAVPFCGSYLGSYEVSPEEGTTMELMGK